MRIPKHSRRTVGLLLVLLMLVLLQPSAPASAQESPELIHPPICSAIEPPEAGASAPFCRINPNPGDPASRDVTLLLTATTTRVEIGGYRIETQNYNGAYLPPVVEARAGDTIKVRLVNALAHAGTHPGGPGMAHGSAGASATNLHTHGLIVTANNSRQMTPPPTGDGDNVFVTLGRGDSLDYNIPIPTDLPASLLDGEEGIMPHPTGLYWYHTHLHGISSTQVAGGMSGLLSIGARDANVVAVDLRG
jgi:FtsP/CotA-like multicopper oxidase with cupredoxin domain